MPLRVVEPDKPGLELRTFECQKCYGTESFVAPIGRGTDPFGTGQGSSSA
jgi:hypothetical protein